MNPTHALILTDRTDYGAEEWTCPTCRRRLLVRWQPEFEKLVLDEGDSSASHVGATGGPSTEGLGEQPEATGPARLPASQLRWLADNGIDWGEAA